MFRFAFLSVVTLNDLLMIAGAMTNIKTLLNFAATMSGLACMLFWIEVVFAFQWFNLFALINRIFVTIFAFRLANLTSKSGEVKTLEAECIA